MDRVFIRYLLIAFGVAALAVGMVFVLRDPPPAKRTYARVSNPLPNDQTLAFRKCSADADCTYVLNGCCDCANGGEELSVRRDQVAAFRDRFSCDRRPCTEIGSAVPCGTGTSVCEAGTCTFRSKRSSSGAHSP